MKFTGYAANIYKPRSYITAVEFDAFTRSAVLVFFLLFYGHVVYHSRQLRRVSLQDDKDVADTRFSRILGGGINPGFVPRGHNQVEKLFSLHNSAILTAASVRVNRPARDFLSPTSTSDTISPRRCVGKLYAKVLKCRAAVVLRLCFDFSGRNPSGVRLMVLTPLCSPWASVLGQILKSLCNVPSTYFSADTRGGNVLQSPKTNDIRISPGSGGGRNALLFSN